MKRRLRIAVAISECGAWNSAGWGFEDAVAESDSELKAHAMEAMDGATTLRWVEFDVEIPEVIVAAVVTDE